MTPRLDGERGGSALEDLVIGFTASSAREVHSRDRFLAELARLADPFSRANAVHVTASAVVIGARGTALHRHKRIGKWLQPGGHVEPGEAPEEAALREAVEETGLPVCHPADGPCMFHLDVHPAGAHVHLDLRYLLLSEDVDPRPAAGESPEARWFELPQALAIADGGLYDALRRVADEEGGLLFGFGR